MSSSKREKLHLAYGPAVFTTVAALLIAVYIGQPGSDSGGDGPDPTPTEDTTTSQAGNPNPTPSTAPPPQATTPPAPKPQALILDNAAEVNSCAPSGNSGSSWKEATPSFLSESHADGFSCKFGFDRPIEGNLEFMVDPNTTRFQAIAGVDDSSENTSLQVRFTAYDATTGRELHAVDASYQSPEPFDINIEGVRRLGLRVKSLSASESLWDSPAVVAWAEPIVK